MSFLDTHGIFHPAMKRRIRILGGSLMLSAMVFSNAEAVLASVCAPGSSMEAMTDMAGMSDMANMDDMSSMDAGDLSADQVRDDTGPAMDCMLMPGDDAGREDGSPADHCPLGPAVGPGCSAVASLPGSDARVALPADPSAAPPASGEARPDPLLIHALFRPPRS